MYDKETDGQRAAETVEATPQQALADDFRQQYLVVCECDLQALSLDRRRATEYLALGRLAHALQAQLGYGNWGQYLQTNGYVERTISRALRIFRNLKDHPDFAVGLTLAEAERYGEDLARAADDEAKQIAESVERSKRAAATRIGKKAQSARAELRKKVIQALASTDGLEKELKSILEPEPASQAEKPVGAVSADGQQLLVESDATSTLTLKGIYDDMQAEGPSLDQEAKGWQHGEDPCQSCDYIWNVLSEVMTDNIAVTDDERVAFDGFVAIIGDEDRALRVMLALAHDLLCE
jgi:hypothetical protein